MSRLSPVRDPSRDPVTLHLICGKIAAGKSTLARTLGARAKTISLREDQWLANLYPGEMHTVADYIRCSARLRTVTGPLVRSLLEAGLSVVMDFPANTVERRQWLRTLFVDLDVQHQLHFLDPGDAECKRRLRDRNAAGEHEFAPSEADFDQISRYFEPPAEDEGFNVVRY